MKSSDVPDFPFDQNYIAQIIDVYRITLAQAVFCEYYLSNGFNGTKAASAAGYAKPSVSSTENLRQPKVQKYLSHRFAEARMGADEVLARLSRIARADVGDFLNADGTIDVSKAVRDSGDTSVIKKIKTRTRYIPAEDRNKPPTKEVITELELHDPVRTLELAGRFHRLFVDVVVKPDDVPTPETLSDDQLTTEARRLVENGDVDPDDIGEDPDA